MKNSKKIFYLLILFILLFSIQVDAQELPGFFPDVDDETPVAAPIDGFMGVAIAAGICIGIRKLRDKK